MPSGGERGPGPYHLTEADFHYAISPRVLSLDAIFWSFAKPGASPFFDRCELSLGLGVGFLVWGSFEDHRTDGLCGCDVVRRWKFVADGVHVTEGRLLHCPSA